MKVDFKVTIWESTAIPEDKEQEILTKIKAGTIASANDIHAQYSESEWDVQTETLYDTSEQMEVEDNDGGATLEVFNDSGKSIFINVLEE